MAVVMPAAMMTASVSYNMLTWKRYLKCYKFTTIHKNLRERAHHAKGDSLRDGEDCQEDKVDWKTPRSTVSLTSFQYS